MSLRNKFFSILTIALGIVVFSAFAMAQDTAPTTPSPNKAERPDKGRGFGQGRGGHGDFEGRRGPGGPGGDVMGMLRGLNLTDTQKTQIHSILESNKPDQATMETARTLHKAKRDGTITAEQETQLKALGEQARAKAKSVHEQILGVLTADQKAQIEQRKQQMKQNFEERKQMREKRIQDRQTQPKTATSPDKPKGGN